MAKKINQTNQSTKAYLLGIKRISQRNWLVLGKLFHYQKTVTSLSYHPKAKLKDVRNYYAFEKCILFCGNKNSEVDRGCLRVSKRGVWCFNTNMGGQQ